jgi:hypothetical protein
MPVQVALERLPPLVITQGAHDSLQSVITPVQAADRLPQTLAQGLLPLLSPRLNGIHPMVRLGENVRQPAYRHSPQAEPLPVAMRGKVFIQQDGHAHPFLLSYQQGNIIDAFTGEDKCLGHAESLPQFSELVQKMSEP